MVTPTWLLGESSWKGGAIILASFFGPTTVEFHRCDVEHNTAGQYFKDDPQGEGGAIVVGGGTTVVVEDCLFSNNTVGKKVCFGMLAGQGRRDLIGGGRFLREGRTKQATRIVFSCHVGQQRQPVVIAERYGWNAAVTTAHAVAAPITQHSE